MRHRGSGFVFLALALASLAVLSGCIGKGTSNQGGTGVQTVTLNPGSTISLEFGTIQSFTVTARDGNGRAVISTVHYSSDNNASLTVSDDGRACAGTWDSLSIPVRCSPGVAGIAHVTATVDGVSSAPTTIYVHQHVQSIALAPAQTRQCPKPGITNCPCFSQGETFMFQATAMGANSVDITNTVGPFTWTAASTNVLTVNSVKDLPNDQVQVTAKDPGITQIFASISGTTSTPLSYTTCLVKSIKLQLPNNSTNSVNINAGGTATITAETVDTLDTVLTKPPLTWNTSNPDVATVSTSGGVTGKQEGGIANISASCTPPTCNIGVLPGLPIYSSGGTTQNGQPAFGVITTHVLQSKPPTGTAWTATTDCADNFNCTSVMFPVTPGTTPIGTSLTLPFTPTSMLFNPGGTRVYLGSNKGLMFVDVTASTLTVSTASPATTPCNFAVCGKPLAISADNNKIVVADTVTIPNQVYIWDASHATNPPVDLLIDGATAATFSPDQMKLFITTSDGKLFVFSTVDALHQVTTAAPAKGINFSADGSFAYVAGTPANGISGFAGCNLQDMGTNTPALNSNPLLVFPLPDVREDHVVLTLNDRDPVLHSVITENLLALEPPNLQFLKAQFTRDELADPSQMVCNGTLPKSPQTASVFKGIDPPDFIPFGAGDSVDLGQGNFTPLFTQLTGDGSKVIVVAENIPAVLFFDVASHTTSGFPLAGGALPRAATSTLDGTQVFVAACDAFQDNDPSKPCTNASVHIVNPQQGGDIQQAVYTNPNTNDSMCTNLPGVACLPNLLAIRPQ